MDWSLVNRLYLIDFNYWDFWTDYIDPGYTNKSENPPCSCSQTHSSLSSRQTIYHVYLLRSFIPKCTYTNVYIYLFLKLHITYSTYHSFSVVREHTLYDFSPLKLRAALCPLWSFFWLMFCMYLLNTEVSYSGIPFVNHVGQITISIITDCR